MHHKSFGMHLHARFKKKKSFRRITYFVNREPFILDDEEILIMNRYYREQNKHTNKQSGPPKGYWKTHQEDYKRKTKEK